MLVFKSKPHVHMRGIKTILTSTIYGLIISLISTLKVLAISTASLDSTQITSSKRITGKKAVWHPLVLCLSDREMKPFLQSIKTKKEPKKPDKFFGIGFDEPSTVYATRGFDPHKDVSAFLLAPMISGIREFFN